MRGSTPQPHTTSSVRAEDWFGADALSSIGGGASKPGDVAIVDALWALRDYILKDSMRLDRHVEEFS